MNTFTIQQDITVKTAQAILNETSTRIASSEIKEIDFKNVKNVDSAAMALLIEWKKLNNKIQFANLPNQLKNLLKISNAKEIIKPKKL